MKFFNVKGLDEVLALKHRFEQVENEIEQIENLLGRILAEDIVSGIDIPDFHRSTMDGFAVRAEDLFGASESSPSYLTLKGVVRMGMVPSFSVGNLETARISTGGMLPDGTDSVVMMEHTEMVDKGTVEVYKSVAPGQHVISRGEDVAQFSVAAEKGSRIRPQEMGLMAAIGKKSASVYRKPVVAVLSTGDEIVPINDIPDRGKIRDVNTYTLMGQLMEHGAIPLPLGIAEDSCRKLASLVGHGLADADMVLISGGSSLGIRDFTIDVLKELPDSEILVHGISISPGKPTIIARSGRKLVFGLPGHITSCMVVAFAVVIPFLNHIRGLKDGCGIGASMRVRATLTRNVPSVQGRTDFVRVRLIRKGDTLFAEPLLGKSGLIRTMLDAEGLMVIDRDTEGAYGGEDVFILPFL